MRWLLRFLVLLVILCVAYVGTAVVSLKGLVEDAQKGDTAPIMSRVDLGRLQNSLAEQIVRAHFSRIEQTRPVKTIERLATPSVVNALLQSVLTPDNIAAILHSGTLPALDRTNTSAAMLPPLSSMKLDNPVGVLVRLRPKTPVQLQVLLDDTGQAAIRMHFEGTHWKLSGIDLPPAALEKLIAGVFLG